MVFFIDFYLKIITKGGFSWSQLSAPQGTWRSVASDSIGQYLAACQYSNYIFVSTSGCYYYCLYSHLNIIQILIILGGSTWTKTSAPLAQWTMISSNSSGMFLAAVPYTVSSTTLGSVYTSSDGIFFILLSSLLLLS